MTLMLIDFRSHIFTLFFFIMKIMNELINLTDVKLSFN